MKRWPKKPLGTVAEFINGRAFKPSDWSTKGVPIIRIQNLTNLAAPVNRFEGVFDKRYAIKNGDLLVSWSATLDVFSWDRGDAILNQHIFNVVPDSSQVSKPYLLYAIKSVMDELRSKTHGTTMKHITKGPFERTEIPVPPLVEQERLVKLLDEVGALRKLRAQADRRTANLIPALFHEMFGVPFGNAIPYPVKKLSELIRQGDKINYGVVQPGDDVPDGVPIVRAGDFNGMSIDHQHLKRISPEIEKSYSRSRLQGDEILITCVGSIGNVALADPSLTGFNIVRAVARVPLHNQIDRVFVANQLITPELQNFFRKETRTVTQPTLNIRQIEETPIILPPLSLQKKFAERVAEIRALESGQCASRRRLDDLFQSMLHRAFSGEL
jgi:type I restriction enzyme S subunit